MEFFSPKQALLQAVTGVQGVIERTPARLILLNLRIIAKDGVVTIIGTDNKVFLTDTCEADIKAEGEISVTGTALSNWLKLLPNDQVRFFVDDKNWVEVGVGDTKHHLPGLPTDEFPSSPDRPEDLKTFTMKGAEFAYLLNRTHFAISDDETRPILCGLFFRHKEGTTSVVSTDGHRLALARSDQFELPDDVEFLIPRKVVRELRRILVDFADDHIEVGISDSHQFYKIDTISLMGRNIAGNFPNFESVIPRDRNHTVTFERARMADLLKRIMHVQTSISRGMLLNVIDEVLRATAENPEMGDVTDSFKVDKTGDNFEVTYNPRYFLETLQTIDTDQVRLELGDAMGPGVIHPDGEHDPELTYILMPMKR